jgi:hypothetical protein
MQLQLTHYAPLLIAYAVIVTLFLKNRYDVKRLRYEAQERVNAAASGVSQLSLEVQGLRENVRQLEECPVGAATAHGINLTKRAQVLRMYRRGDTRERSPVGTEDPPHVEPRKLAPNAPLRERS